MSKKIDKDQIAKISKLARLELAEADSAKLEEDLEEILEYVAQLAEVSTVGVKVSSQVHEQNNIFRDDIRKESMPPQEIENIAPDFAAGGFRVPKVI